ncbi:hypothetical protein [Salsuginibacillus kocurii]|uniref:hypothetical protein n=1 Tax=Salsuginibacillus kocurii TaxID=427078 RepID=UPI0003624E09|nr:hypothetical protein [Salsuginibacillus kocurii]
MTLEAMYAQLESQLAYTFGKFNVKHRMAGGVHFFYLPAHNELEYKLQKTAARVIQGKQLQANIHYSRYDPGQDQHIYRVSFVVPLKKRFCCGNGCTDCIRLKR